MSEIDVSKCEFYNNCYCNCYIDNYGDCYHKCTDEELKNCYYKQLQQLKQENKRLKNERTIDLRNQLEQLKAENEELKAFIKEDLSPTCQRLGKENEQYRFLVGKINRDRIEYKRCLDEIKEQIEDIISEKCNKPCEECTGKPLCDKYYILQKIKEVKGNE